MFLTSVDELIQQDFRLSRTLHDELSSIRLIRTYFSNTFLSWVLYFWQGNSQEQFRNVLYSVYMLNAQSEMQSQIVLTMAILRVVDIVPILLKQKKLKSFSCFQSMQTKIIITRNKKSVHNTKSSISLRPSWNALNSTFNICLWFNDQFNKLMCVFHVSVL